MRRADGPHGTSDPHLNLRNALAKCESPIGMGPRARLSDLLCVDLVRDLSNNGMAGPPGADLLIATGESRSMY